MKTPIGLEKLPFGILALALVSSTCFAGAFDRLAVSNGAQTEVRSLLTAGNFKQAITVWGTAYPLPKTAHEHATLAYLLNKSGWPMLGWSYLFETTSPRQLSSEMLALWRAEQQSNVNIQKGWIIPDNQWLRWLGIDEPNFRVKNKRDLVKAMAKAENRSATTENERARIWWRVATEGPQIGELNISLEALKKLEESGQNVLGRDQIWLARARVLYQKGELPAAEHEYQKIPKNSDLWLIALEERTWSAVRAKDYDRAAGHLVTLLSPALSALTGPESFYLANLTALNICDYSRIFKNSETFKKLHRERLSILQELAQRGAHPSVTEAMARLEREGVSVEGAGPTIWSLPHLSLRDRKFLRAMELRRSLLTETASLEKRKESLMGLSDWIESISRDARSKADRLQKLSALRLRTLARAEVDDYRRQLNRMHIIEGEVIHRLAVDDRLKGERNKLPKAEKSADVLTFPYTSDEVWFDELDNYKAQVKDCPSLKGASL